MNRFFLSLTCAIAILAQGCMIASMSPHVRFLDDVHRFNDQTRWGLVRVAVDRVAPSYRIAFRRSRRLWGESIRIAETDVTDVNFADDGQSAVSIVEVSWYDLRTMEVYSSTLLQHWMRVDDGFYLDEEEILSGTEHLLQRPREDADVASTSPRG